MALIRFSPRPHLQLPLIGIPRLSCQLKNVVAPAINGLLCDGHGKEETEGKETKHRISGLRQSVSFSA